MGVSKYWRYSQKRMQELFDSGMIVQTKPGTVPQRKQYLDQGKGVAVQSLWADIEALSASASERLGYPTQKPEALLERIIRATTDEGDTVLDPFCGCGTAIAVAERLHRKWIGIDVTFLAIGLIRQRLRDAFGDSAKFELVGAPTSVQDAQSLASENPYQFQWWLVDLAGAQPTEQKKGADRGIDGRIFFHDEGPSGETKQIILSVKAGHTGPAHIRDLAGVVQREKAAIGVLLTMEKPTRPMRTEAASAGFYTSPWDRQNYPRLQLLTVEELLSGKRIERPASGDERTFKRAPKAKTKAKHKQGGLFDGDEPPPAARRHNA